MTNKNHNPRIQIVLKEILTEKIEKLKNGIEEGDDVQLRAFKLQRIIAYEDVLNVLENEIKQRIMHPRIPLLRER